MKKLSLVEAAESNWVRQLRSPEQNQQFDTIKNAERIAVGILQKWKGNVPMIQKAIQAAMAASEAAASGKRPEDVQEIFPPGLDLGEDGFFELAQKLKEKIHVIPKSWVRRSYRNGE